MPAPVMLPGWTKYAPLTVNKDLVGVGGVSDFTMVAPLTLPDDFASALAFEDGRDLRFTLADGTLLSHELAACSKSGKTLQAWPKVTSLLSSANTTIYAQMGNPSATMPSVAEQYAAWGSGFAGAYGFGTVAAPNLTDRTGNGNDLTDSVPAPGSTTWAAGVVEQAIGWPFDWRGYGCTKASPSLPSGDAARTLSLWYKCNAGALDADVCSWGNGSGRTWALWVTGTSIVADCWPQSGATFAVTRDTQWHHVMISLAADTDTSQTVLVYDGVARSTTGGSGKPSIVPTQLKLGGVSNLVGSYGHNGSVDEVRVSNVARSAAWGITEYNNQRAPAEFSTWGAVQSAGLILPHQYNAGYNSGYNAGRN